MSSKKFNQAAGTFNMETSKEALKKLRAAAKTGNLNFFKHVASEHPEVISKLDRDIFLTAVEYGQKEIFDYMLTKNIATIDPNPDEPWAIILSWSLRQNNAEDFIIHMFESGLDIDAYKNDLLKTISTSTHTHSDPTKLFEYLIQNGADINVLNEWTYISDHAPYHAFLKIFNPKCHKIYESVKAGTYFEQEATQEKVEKLAQADQTTKTLYKKNTDVLKSQTKKLTLKRRTKNR